MWFLKILKIIYPENFSLCFEKKLVDPWVDFVTCAHTLVHVLGSRAVSCQWCTVPRSPSYFWEASRHVRLALRRNGWCWDVPSSLASLPSEQSVASVRGSLVQPVSSRYNRHRAFSVWWRLRVVQAVMLKTVSLFSSSIRSVMQKYLAERNEITFDKIFNQKIGKSCLFI